MPSLEGVDDDEVVDAGAEELRLKATGAGMADAFPLAPAQSFPLLGDSYIVRSCVLICTYVLIMDSNE